MKRTKERNDRIRDMKVIHSAPLVAIR